MFFKNAFQFVMLPLWFFKDTKIIILSIVHTLYGSFYQVFAAKEMTNKNPSVVRMTSLNLLASMLSNTRTH
jgi:hypothetical protein